MNNKIITDKFGPIRKGLLEFLVLKIISVRSAYAGEILEKLNETEFVTQEGTLYPLFSRMRREELLEYEWVESEAGPPRKYYQLTTKGKEALEELSNYWHKINNTIKTIGK